MKTVTMKTVTMKTVTMKTVTMKTARKDRAPWLLLPCVLLALGGVTILAPRQAAQAAPASSAVPGSIQPGIGDDGDGDELLEHWGDPKYVREERLQMAGMAAGFLLAGGFTCRGRLRRRALPVTPALEDATGRRKAA